MPEAVAHSRNGEMPSGRGAAPVGRGGPFTLLTAAEEFALLERWTRFSDNRARDRLLLAYVPLVTGMARRYGRPAIPREDLVQEGMIGLMEAFDRFDPGRGVRFSSYAKLWVRSAIRAYLIRNASIVAAGKSESERLLFFKLPYLQARLAARAAGHDVTRWIATATGVSATEVEGTMRLLAGRDATLTPYDDGDGPAAAIDLADHRPDPEASAIAGSAQRHGRMSLARALDVLTPRERMIVERHRLQSPGVTLAELGAELGITKERVRQIEVAAFDKLRAALKRTVEREDELFATA